MKIRTSFVTNSSSSSFVCEVCGTSEGGYDLCMDDAGMYQCENGHVFCKHHAIKEVESNGDPVTIEICPICQFKSLHKGDALKYLMSKDKVTESNLLNTLKNEFGDYKTFKQKLKDIK